MRFFLLWSTSWYDLKPAPHQHVDLGCVKACPSNLSASPEMVIKHKLLWHLRVQGVGARVMGSLKKKKRHKHEWPYTEQIGCVYVLLHVGFTFYQCSVVFRYWSPLQHGQKCKQGCFWFCLLCLLPLLHTNMQGISLVEHVVWGSIS